MSVAAKKSKKVRLAGLMVTGGKLPNKQMKELVEMVKNAPKGQPLEITVRAAKSCPTCGRPLEGLITKEQCEEMQAEKEEEEAKKDMALQDQADSLRGR